MKALFKHLSAITQGEPGSVADNTSYSIKKFSTPFLSTTLLAVLLGVPQIPIIGSGKAVAQNAASCPAGTAPETVQFQASDSLLDLTQQFNIGGVDTVLILSEEFPAQVIDRTESRFDSGVYGGVQGPNLRLNIGPGKPPETGNLAPGSATITINFAQPVTLASPLTLLDVDQEGERDNNRFFRDRIAVSAANNNANVPVNLQALGPFTQVSGNTAFGITENSLPDNGDANVSITPQGPVDQISILYTPDTSQPRGQDQTLGLAPFTICAPTQQVGSIGDTVYRDNNNNNVQDEGDVGIGGVPVTLTLPGGDGELGTPDDTTQTTTTNEQGIYSFPNLPAGNYLVTAATPDGLTPTQTQPNPIQLQVGENTDIVDFGFSAPGSGTETGSLGDTVYRDDNNNNVQDAGEVGIGGVELTLILPGADGQPGTDDDLTQTTNTNEQGIYTFPNLPAGNYLVTSATPDGLTPTQTQPNPVELQPGQNIDTVDFGFSAQQTGSLGDTVYRDNNNNNVQDEGDVGIGGVEVTLTLPGDDGQLDTDDDTTQTTTTNDQGIYTFPNLPAGNYRVNTATPDGLTPTQTQPDAVELQSGQNIDTVDFGFSPQQTGSIGDTVYTDDNSNNVQDDGEEGIPGATVSLTLPGPDEQLGTADDTTQTTTTDDNGNYTFPNLPAGNYTVTATSPREGDTATQTQPDPIELQPGQNFEDADFGFVPQPLGEGQGSIGDTVYNDTNRNNQQDDGETGIPGATVTLTNSGEDDEFGTPDDITLTTTTNENGNYNFPSLPAGNYRVTTTTPDGLTPTQTPPETVALAQNQTNNDVDFGFAPEEQGTGSLGDTVYNDTNNNNQQDEGETGIPGVTVTLTSPGEDGELGNEDDTTQTTTTGENGIYGFTNLPPANYTVSTETPEGLTPTQTQPDIINLQSGQNIDTIDFGFVGQQQQGTGSIGDTVYNDINNNGQQDENEPGIGGVIVNYAGTGPDGVFGNSLDDDDTSGRTRTDANGRYIFPNLPAGTYRITINDQNQEPIRGFSQTQTPNNLITLDEGENFEDADFGYTQSTGTIGDTVYRDNNSDGTQNEGEPGIPNVEVTLVNPGPDNQFGTADDTTQSTTTNENGIYSFPNVPIGNYQVVVNNPPEDLSPTQTPSNPISLQPDQNFDEADFGFSPQQVGTIGDLVFFDNDGDSTPDGDESGISGINLVLRDAQGNEVATTTTEEDGSYNFVAPPGTYTVTVVNPPQGLNPTLTQESPVNLQAGQNIDTVDFGFQPPANGSIGDTVFADVNGNRVQDEGEPGVSGVVIRLVRPGQDGVFGTDDDQIEEQRTDNTETVAFNENTPGQYSFDNLPPGDYQVQIALPDGSILTTVTNPIPVTLEPSQNFVDADFGVRMTGLPGSIGDTVFVDTNGNGVQDYTDSNSNGVKDPNEEGEEGIPGVQLTLRDSDGEIVDTATTNQNGNYTFNGLPLVNYTVEAARPTDFSPTTDTTLSAQLTQANPNTNEIDFGFRPGLLGAASADGPLDLSLIKRITRINDTTFNQFVDGEGEDDNNLNEISPVRGVIQAENLVQSGDIVEYTIYFLKEGEGELQNVRVCDFVPQGTALVLNSIRVEGERTGGDDGREISEVGTIPEDFQDICGNTQANNGAILVNVGTLSDGVQTGSIRFRVQVR